VSEPSARRLTDRLSGVLGPAAAELTCEQCFDRLGTYVELELSGRDADEAIPGMHAHLEGCPACAEDHESLRAPIGAERQSA
jgi:hypothetical protein